MNAELSNWCTGENRLYLKDIVPLETPVSILMEPASACNFQCYYCEFHKKKCRTAKYLNTTKSSSIMPYGLFEKIVSDMRMFPQKVKAINFSRNGEPLLNKRIADMVYLAKKEEVCNEVKIITNGSLLNQTLSKKLINSGLDVLRISVQGISSEQYKKNCNCRIQFDEFLSNIKYFYKNKKNCKVFIKIIDEMILGEEVAFYDMFGDICDEIAIEHMIKPFDADDERQNDSKGKNMFMEIVDTPKICSSPFYTLNISSNGNVIPCCWNTELSLFGNAKDNSIVDIWNSNALNELRVMILKRNYCHELCNNCNMSFSSRSSKDNIDEVGEYLLECYKKS